MYMSQCYITIRRRIHQNTKSYDIVDLTKISGSFKVFQPFNISSIALKFLIETI